MVKAETNIKGIKLEVKEHRLQQYAANLCLLPCGGALSLVYTFDVFRMCDIVPGLRVSVDRTQMVWLMTNIRSKGMVSTDKDYSGQICLCCLV